MQKWESDMKGKFNNKTVPSGSNIEAVNKGFHENAGMPPRGGKFPLKKGHEANTPYLIGQHNRFLAPSGVGGMNV
jgi:hypothetical protein